MVQFKAEYQYSKILVKTQSLGKIEINAETADPEKWSKVPELAFMFEEVETTNKKTAIVEKVVVETIENNDGDQENEISIDDMTKKEIEAVLKNKGIDYPKKATKAELFKIMIEA